MELLSFEQKLESLFSEWFFFPPVVMIERCVEKIYLRKFQKISDANFKKFLTQIKCVNVSETETENERNMRMMMMKTAKRKKNLRWKNVWISRQGKLVIGNRNSLRDFIFYIFEMWNKFNLKREILLIR